MNARLLALAAIVLALITGCGGAGGITLQQVQAAFARNGVPLPCTIKRGESNSPCNTSVFFATEGHDPALTHLIGIAYTANHDSSKLRFATVFDSSASAKSEVSGTRDPVIVVQNVVYSGEISPSVRRAMASLRKK